MQCGAAARGIRAGQPAKTHATSFGNPKSRLDTSAMMMQDEDDDDQRVVPQLRAGRPDDLAQLVEDLADEQAERAEQPRDRVAALVALATTSAGAPGLVRHVRHVCAFLFNIVSMVSRRPDDLHTQGRRDSNPQPPVLETGAVPIEPLPYGTRRWGGGFREAVLPHAPGTPKHGASPPRRQHTGGGGPARTRPPDGGHRPPCCWTALRPADAPRRLGPCRRDRAEPPAPPSPTCPPPSWPPTSTGSGRHTRRSRRPGSSST